MAVTANSLLDAAMDARQDYESEKLKKHQPDNSETEQTTANDLPDLKEPAEDDNDGSEVSFV
jgi:hypothetical protein